MEVSAQKVRNKRRASLIPDNDRIRKAQEEYRQAENEKEKEKAYNELFNSIRSCAKKLIYYEREKKGFFLSPEDVEEKSLIATEYVIKQFRNRPDFMLQIPSAYIRLNVYTALYHRNKNEKNLKIYFYDNVVLENGRNEE